MGAEFPWTLRLRLAADRRLLTEMLRIFGDRAMFGRSQQSGTLPKWRVVRKPSQPGSHLKTADLLRSSR